MKVLIWGEKRERVWATANSILDVLPDCEITVGCADQYQQHSRILEAFCGFCKFNFESGFDGKLDFIANHKDDKFIFAVEGILFNHSILDFTTPDPGVINFFNIALDGGKYISDCNPAQGGFLASHEEMKTSDGGQSLLCFVSGGSIKYPTFFRGGFGEALTLSKINQSKIVKAYIRYIGNLDLQISQSGFYVLVMGLKSTGLFDQYGSEVADIIDEKVRDRVYKKVESDLNRLP